MSQTLGFDAPQPGSSSWFLFQAASGGQHQSQPLLWRSGAHLQQKQAGLMLMTLTAVGTSTRRRLPGSTLVTTFLQPASSARLTGLHPQAPPTGGPTGPRWWPWVDWAGWFSVLGGSLFPLQTSVTQHSWKRVASTQTPGAAKACLVFSRLQEDIKEFPSKLVKAMRLFALI